LNGFAAGAGSPYDRHGRPAYPEPLGEKPDKRLVGGAVDRSCRNANPDLITVNPDHFSA